MRGLQEFNINDPHCPEKLRKAMLESGTKLSWAIGRTEILKETLYGLFCSKKCPGDIILRLYDLTREYRDEGKVLVSGFHSIMEKECLHFLLKGTQPIVIYPARCLHNIRLKKEYRTAIDNERLLLLSPFPAQNRRITSEFAEKRNKFVAAMTDVMIVAHASEGSSTMARAQESLSHDKPVWAINKPGNKELLGLGAAPI